MNDKLKPVHCRCGGKAEIFHIAPDEGYEGSYCVRCTECLIQTPFFNKDKNKAIEVWNRVMDERTAKVKLQDICWEDIRRYKEGMCASCGRSVYDHAKYCDECGCRLEWDE